MNRIKEFIKYIFRLLKKSLTNNFKTKIMRKFSLLFIAYISFIFSNSALAQSDAAITKIFFAFSISLISLVI